MKTLTKSHLTTKAEHLAALEKSAAELEAAIDAYNAKLEELQAPITNALEKYNEAVTDADAFRDDVACEMEGHYEDKSERWQESDAGQQYAQWKGEWQDAVLEQIEIEFPQPIEMPETCVDVLDQLPDECE